MVKCTVQVGKENRMTSTYHVVACSLGGAERICLGRVYGAKTALATEGWVNNETTPDFITNEAAFELWRGYLKTCGS